MKKLLISLFAGVAALNAAAVTPLWMRYASISPDGKEIAFAYKGDLYKVNSAGGDAVRLTSNESMETAPVWSNDGKQIAFASNRYGNYDVFVMPQSVLLSIQQTKYRVRLLQTIRRFFSLLLFLILLKAYWLLKEC